MHLALELRNNSYYPLSKDFFDIIEKNEELNTLENIDNFTIKHSKEEIFESIRRSNIEFLKPLEEMNLVIIYQDKKKIRKLKIYTADDINYLNFNEINFLLELLNNAKYRNTINQIQEYFSKNHIPQDLKLFLEKIKDYSVISIISEYNKLLYNSKRLLKDYIFEINMKLENKNSKKFKLENNN